MPVTKDFIAIIILLKQLIDLMEVNKTVKNKPNVEHAKGQRPFNADLRSVLWSIM